MKVAFVTNSLSRNAGGLFYSVRFLADSLSRQGCTLLVVAPEHGNDVQDRTAWGDLATQQYPSLQPHRIVRSLRDFGPDIIHLHGIWLPHSLVISQFSRRHAIPVVVSTRGMLDPWALSHARWKKRVIAWLYEQRNLHNAACIHALCTSEAEAIRAYGLRNPIAVVPNGVDLPDLPDFGGQRPATGGRRRLLFLGRIHPKKGLKELIEAWALVRQCANGRGKSLGGSTLSSAKGAAGMRTPEWQLVIAGWDDGGHMGNLKQQATDLGLEWDENSDFRSSTSDLCFVGPQFGAEKDRLLRDVDAFILPSFSEGLPMSVLEAWGYALPVVMTQFCNLPEGFSADAAVKVSPDSGSIASGLNKLFSMDETDLVEMGKHGHALVADRFVWPNIAAEMQNVYRWVLGKGDRPACVETV